MSWDTVIGLEIHVQLATKTKIFSGASTAYGAEPNTQACAIDLAMPGTLPVLNKQAVYEAGLWGVPSMRLLDEKGDQLLALWGQDRLWLFAQEIQRQLAARRK